LATTVMRTSSCRIAFVLANARFGVKISLAVGSAE
jgi:hypothetical protein